MHDLEDVWEFMEFCAREAFLLRSMLEYLRTAPESPEKTEKLRHWKSQIGLQLGNPTLMTQADTVLRTALDLPPEQRRLVLRKSLAHAQEMYFPQQ